MLSIRHCWRSGKKLQQAFERATTAHVALVLRFSTVWAERAQMPTVLSKKSLMGLESLITRLRVLWGDPLFGHHKFICYAYRNPRAGFSECGYQTVSLLAPLLKYRFFALSAETTSPTHSALTANTPQSPVGIQQCVLSAFPVRRTYRKRTGSTQQHANNISRTHRR